jgi:hypothetical protein
MAGQVEKEGSVKKFAVTIRGKVLYETNLKRDAVDWMRRKRAYDWKEADLYKVVRQR